MSVFGILESMFDHFLIMSNRANFSLSSRFAMFPSTNNDSYACLVSGISATDHGFSLFAEIGSNNLFAISPALSSVVYWSIFLIWLNHVSLFFSILFSSISFKMAILFAHISSAIS